MSDKNYQTGRAHDVYRYKHNPLDSFFTPKSVAVIGATEREGSTGRTIIWNLMQNSFGGVIYPVNPTRGSVLGIKAYPSIKDIPDPVDLAVIVTPAPSVPAIIRDCVEMGVKSSIIISAGFKETGPEGAELERQIMEEARRGRMRIIGPNCLGVMSPNSGLNATFAARMANPGSVGFISQSGALCTAVLDWSMRENVGFSAFVSIGSMLDVDWGDLIHYLGDDPKTKSIVIYMESIGNARSFISAAREVALTKPIIVIKPGRTEAAAKAAASHTGSLTGSDEVLRAAFRRCGVLRVDTIDGLFSMAEVLAKQPRPTGPRLTIVTNAGGPGVLATDALITSGGELSELSAETMAALNELLPGPWSHNNPIDILGDAPPERYAEALEIAAQDPNSDGLLVILTPQAMTAPTQTAQALKKMYRREDGRPFGKPLLASWMGGADIAAGESILNQTGIPTYTYPDTAAIVFNYMWRYTQRLGSLYETPTLPAYSEEDATKHAQIEQMLSQIRQSGRTILTEYESKLVLSSYGIPTVETRLARSADEAIALAEEIGYPVVLKLNSETITHKTDVGGVRLDLAQPSEVRHAYETMETAVTQKFGAEHFLGVTVQPMLSLKDGYELIIGSSPDPQFGPVLLFGTGGTLVEVFKDRSLGLPPLTTTLARRMVEDTKIYKALQGVRGRAPVDLAALDELLVRFSQLVVEQRWIKEIDINPLFVSSSNLIALDARVVLYEPEVTEDMLPELAIRAYPSQYVQPYTSTDQTEFVIRPIRPEDEPLMVKFHQTLSEQSVYLRYFRAFQYDQRVAHDRLIRICFVDYDRDIALVTEKSDPTTGEKEIVAAGRLSRIHGTDEAEFALLVNDACQDKGIGTETLRRLLEIGRDEGVKRVIAYLLTENRGMYHICKKLGFSFEREAELIKATIDL
ncbi:MAG: bifunctional acetate--CoA ligase family protein/GNAT family N-acetyltransferase [Ardenticatenaceae bacterium]|nr:bifunctional acetate--CoA ligase family protein/GNAT family N-acetyltransferase [Ardenticatenaceae bacterium]